MKKTVFQNSNIVANMALEGFNLDKNDIDRLDQLSSPDLSKREIANMIKGMKQDILKEIGIDDVSKVRNE